MFNSIHGRLTEKRSESVCIDTAGVEWEIFVPPRSVEELVVEAGQARLYTWLHHYEDGMRLYGFASPADRSVFLELMKVEGIGPRQAMKIVSGIRAAELALALEQGDLDTLMRVPGVGPKMAQKMLLALKGKLVALAETQTVGSGSTSTPKATLLADVTRALVDMGFQRNLVEKSVRAAALASTNTDPKAREQEIFRLALVELSAGG